FRPVGQHRHNDVRARGDIAARLAAFHTLSRDGVGQRGDDVEGYQTVASLMQISQHRFAHDAESDKSDGHLFYAPLTCVPCDAAPSQSRFRQGGAVKPAESVGSFSGGPVLASDPALVSDFIQYAEEIFETHLACVRFISLRRSGNLNVPAVRRVAAKLG